MTNQNHPPIRIRGAAETSTSGGSREPDVTRYSHPIRTVAPCAGDICWIRGTLACHTQMLTEILELLQSQSGDGGGE